MAHVCGTDASTTQSAVSLEAVAIYVEELVHRAMSADPSLMPEYDDGELAFIVGDVMAVYLPARAAYRRRLEMEALQDGTPIAEGGPRKRRAVLDDTDTEATRTHATDGPRTRDTPAAVSEGRRGAGAGDDSGNDADDEGRRTAQGAGGAGGGGGSEGDVGDGGQGGAGDGGAGPSQGRDDARPAAADTPAAQGSFMRVYQLSQVCSGQRTQQRRD